MKRLSLDHRNPTVRKHISLITTGLLSGLAIYFYISASQAEESFVRSVLESSFSALAGVGIVYLLHIITKKLDKLISWKEQTGIRLLTGMLINSMVAFGIAVGLAFTYTSLVKGDSFSILNQEVLIKVGILIFIAVFLYSIIYFGLHSYTKFTKGQIDTVKQERKQIDLQLRSLKAKLSPHFLFNSLNTISSLIHTDKDAAENFIRDLAKSYQYTLTTYDKKWVSVADELEFVKAYHYLLKTRFSEQLQLDVQLSEELMHSKVPPLTLQMLVENAAKHNSMSAERPLRIEISGDKDWIWVQNNKTESPKKITSTEVGLKTIKERYRILANQTIVVENGQFFNVKLPVVV